MGAIRNGLIDIHAITKALQHAITNAPIHSFFKFIIVFAVEVEEEACRAWYVEVKGSMVRQREWACGALALRYRFLYWLSLLLLALS